MKFVDEVKILGRGVSVSDEENPFQKGRQTVGMEVEEEMSSWQQINTCQLFWIFLFKSVIRPKMESPAARGSGSEGGDLIASSGYRWEHWQGMWELELSSRTSLCRINGL
jgi:hypothetical protein